MVPKSEGGASRVDRKVGRFYKPAAGHPPLYNKRAPISRNAPCPCGSKKKFKHCHGGNS